MMKDVGVDLDKKKVLHVLNSNRFSGAENVVCQIIKMFEKDVEMVYVSRDGEIRDTLADKGIRFCPVTQLSYGELKRVIEEYHPDIIHGHDIRACIAITPFSHRAELIHTIHGNDVRMRKLTAKSILYWISTWKASHIFWVSRTCLEQFRFCENVRKKSTVLYNVINPAGVLEKYNQDTNDYMYDAIYLGRLCYPKNPQRFVEVIKLAVEKKPDLSAAIVGTGEFEVEVKELCKKYHLENNIDFIGFKKNPYKILGSSKVLVMTSDWEGTPMVSLEAMALGIPIISTPTDGMKDIVECGENGFLSEDVDVLAERLVQVISDDVLWSQMSEEQKRRSEEINNIKNYKNSLLKAYEK